MKFKVWDSENKYFIPDSLLDSYVVNSEGNLCSNHHLLDIAYSSLGNMLIVYSTGKTDKNGVEEYDGDIIKFEKYFKGFNPLTNEREWDAICLIEWNQEELKFSMTEKDGNQYTFASTNWFCLSGEIIGSKYQNPELLNKNG